MNERSELTERQRQSIDGTLSALAKTIGLDSVNHDLNIYPSGNIEIGFDLVTRSGFVVCRVYLISKNNGDSWSVGRVEHQSFDHWRRIV